MEQPRKKIVLVEDDSHTNRLITDNLVMNGFDVTSTFTGEEGLEAIRKNHPDLIVLDLLLPGIDGWKVCRILRGEEPELQKIPIVVVSVLARGDFQSQAMGAISFLNKPFNINDLVDEVEKILDIGVRQRREPT